MAYADPKSAPCHFLLSQSEREDLAAQVNAAILGYPRPFLTDAVLDITHQSEQKTALKGQDKQQSLSIVEVMAHL